MRSWVQTPQCPFWILRPLFWRRRLPRRSETEAAREVEGWKTRVGWAGGPGLRAPKLQPSASAPSLRSLISLALSLRARCCLSSTLTLANGARSTSAARLDLLRPILSTSSKKHGTAAWHATPTVGAPTPPRVSRPGGVPSARAEWCAPPYASACARTSAASTASGVSSSWPAPAENTNRLRYGRARWQILVRTPHQSKPFAC
jgi:hypothetical protein